MKYTVRKAAKAFLCFAIMLATLMGSPVISYAAYDANLASVYAYNRALSYYSKYYDFEGADCTNFVSQCIYVGGIAMVGGSTKLSEPGLLVDSKKDSATSRWYMKKVERNVGYDYWQYTGTWSLVNYFRSYHEAYTGASVKYYNVTSTSKATAVEKTLQRGDIVQYEWDGHRHSVIITAVTKASDGTSTNVKYCAHDVDRQNYAISKFFDYTIKNEYYAIYVIHFS